MLVVLIGFLHHRVIFLALPEPWKNQWRNIKEMHLKFSLMLVKKKGKNLGYLREPTKSLGFLLLQCQWGLMSLLPEQTLQLVTE